MTIIIPSMVAYFKAFNKNPDAAAPAIAVATVLKLALELVGLGVSGISYVTTRGGPKEQHCLFFGLLWYTRAHEVLGSSCQTDKIDSDRLYIYISVVILARRLRNCTYQCRSGTRY